MFWEGFEGFFLGEEGFRGFEIHPQTELTVSPAMSRSWWACLSSVAASAADVTPSAAHYRMPPVCLETKGDTHAHTHK